MDKLLIFFLNSSFLDIVEKNQKPIFLNLRVPPTSVYNLRWRARFKIYRLHISDSDWLNFIHFSGYKNMIRLVSILREREDHGLILISTILKSSVLFDLKESDGFALLRIFPRSIPHYYGSHCSLQLFMYMWYINI